MFTIHLVHCDASEVISKKNKIQSGLGHWKIEKNKTMQCHNEQQVNRQGLEYISEIRDEFAEKVEFVHKIEFC
ncbi:hypothetical protein BpHYR1_003949 [Brachionus plicatilis]|uniref:Uncharacterized protein n=1 Tax=Brachionus plicatilis TaxID=10195 RepID=A0A3M7S7V4_BRAPC|nr:hypothetical protein BpHYR1_003949 [Brachionus plicatilis]